MAQHISYTNTHDNSIIAHGILGTDLQSIEGNYYFNEGSFDVSQLKQVEDAYFCPIKQAHCDYYYVVDTNGAIVGREIGWIYKDVGNSMFGVIQGKLGLYARSSESVHMKLVEDM